MLKNSFVALLAGTALMLPITLDAQEIFDCLSVAHFDKFTFTADRRAGPELGLIPGEPYEVILQDGTPGAVLDIKEAILANLGVTLAADVDRLRGGLEIVDVEYSNLCGVGFITPGTTPG